MAKCVALILVRSNWSIPKQKVRAENPLSHRYQPETVLHRNWLVLQSRTPFSLYSRAIFVCVASVDLEMVFVSWQTTNKCQSCMAQSNHIVIYWSFLHWKITTWIRALFRLLRIRLCHLLVILNNERLHRCVIVAQRDIYVEHPRTTAFRFFDNLTPETWFFALDRTVRIVICALIRARRQFAKMFCAQFYFDFFVWRDVNVLNAPRRLHVDFSEILSRLMNVHVPTGRHFANTFNRHIRLAMQQNRITTTAPRAIGCDTRQNRLTPAQVEVQIADDFYV